MTNETHKFDLEERTAAFGEQVVGFAKRIRVTPVNTQLVRAATSVGANYCEANDCCSKKDFRHKISICRKEAKETKHWLRMVAASEDELRGDARKLWQEAKELNMIFSAILRKREQTV
jgi:four helix bundle protein